MMKKLLMLLFPVMLFGCNKDSGCYKCKTTFTVIVNDGEKDQSYSVSAERTICNTTEAEIRKYEMDNTDSTRYLNPPMTIDTITVTRCY